MPDIDGLDEEEEQGLVLGESNGTDARRASFVQNEESLLLTKVGIGESGYPRKTVD